MKLITNEKTIQDSFKADKDIMTVLVYDVYIYVCESHTVILLYYDCM